MSSNWNVFILISLRCVGVRGLCWWHGSGSGSGSGSGCGSFSLPYILTFIFMHVSMYVHTYACVAGSAFVCGVASHWVFSSFATSLQLVAHRLWFAAFNRRTSNASLLSVAAAANDFSELLYYKCHTWARNNQCHAFLLPPPTSHRPSRPAVPDCPVSDSDSESAPGL